MKKQAPNPEKNPTPSNSTPNREQRTVSETDIACRAYEIYQRRGCEDGSDVDDWLQAEQELKQLPSVVYEVSAKGAA
jgi:hypothetical protein